MPEKEKHRINCYREKKFIFPDILELHLGISCKCTCLFCWRIEERVDEKGKSKRVCKSYGDKKGELLNAEAITRLLEEFQEKGGTRIYLSGGLEPFSSPHIKHVLEFLNKKKCKLEARIYTNGVADCLDRDEFQKLILRSLKRIRFSIHAGKGETYAKVQMPDWEDKGKAAFEFERVKKRLRDLLQRRKDLGNTQDLAQIHVSFLTIGENYKDLEEALDDAKAIGVDHFFIATDMVRSTTKWFDEDQKGKLEKILEKIKKKCDNGQYIPMVVSGERHEGRNDPARDCYVPLKHPAVDPWGYVYSCCYRANPGLQLQNHNYGKYPDNGTLEEILTEAYKAGRIPLSQCAQCPDWEFAYNKLLQRVVPPL